MVDIEERLQNALQLLRDLDLPKEQQNERTARVILALLSLRPEQSWSEATNPMLTIRGIRDFIEENLEYVYAENSRESLRKYSVKQMVNAGILLHNPDDPKRSVNSSKNCYQVEVNALELLRQYGTDQWSLSLQDYHAIQPSLASRYAMVRDSHRIPVIAKEGYEIYLSPGEHSELIMQIITEFASIFLQGSELVYVGDTGTKWGYFDKELLAELGVEVGNHGKMPDVVLFDRKRNWLVLVEATASTGPVDAIRHQELTGLFSDAQVGLVYVTAFPDRGPVFRNFLSQVAWETEVWCASDPEHLIHFNGERFLGPYE